MRESAPLYFADVMAELGTNQCDLCGEWVLQEDLQRMEIDVRGGWQSVCYDCRAGIVWEF